MTTGGAAGRGGMINILGFVGILYYALLFGRWAWEEYPLDLIALFTFCIFWLGIFRWTWTNPPYYRAVSWRNAKAALWSALLSIVFGLISVPVVAYVIVIWQLPHGD